MRSGYYDTKAMKKTKSVRKKLELAEEQLGVAEDGVSEAEEYLDYWQRRVVQIRQQMWKRVRERLLKSQGRKHVLGSTVRRKRRSRT